MMSERSHQPSAWRPNAVRHGIPIKSFALSPFRFADEVRRFSLVPFVHPFVALVGTSAFLLP
jgi:hypothetical protein